MRFFGLVVAAALSIASCAHSVDVPPPPAKFQIVIDDSFSSDERTLIASGFDSWSAAIGRDLTFQYLTADPDAIQSGLAGNPPVGTIYAIKTLDLSTADCVLMASNVACFKTPNRVYFQPDAILAVNAWHRIAAHEAGHSLGLQHTNMTPSVMVSDIQSMADFPSSADVDEYCSLQPEGCPNRTAPKKPGT